MKAAGPLAALLAAACCGHVAADAAEAATTMTPITRVVKILQGISAKTEMQGKAEEDLYEKFVCWAKSTIDSKTASNAAAQARVDSLTTYIDDIQAGRIEFTNERQELTKDLEEVNGEIEAAKALREKEHAEFLDAEAEVTQALSALDKAIGVLEEATADHTEGVLFAQRGAAFLGASSLAELRRDSADLARAAELGDRTLSVGDAVFLRRLLTGEVPERASWKKLNRKATFKMDYKARSFKIQDVLKKMNATFTETLFEVQDKEGKAQASYDELMAVKRAQKGETEQALEVMDKETGARNMNKEDAQEEIDALKKQVEDDTRFIQETKDTWAEKTAEWKERSELRAAEIAAFSKAIEILYNDDARDLMKKSFASQGYLFLQEGSRKAVTASESALQRRSSVTRVIQAAARASGDARLMALAGRTVSMDGSHFTEVLGHIAKMIQDLKEEEEMDLVKKERCEADRANDTRTAAVKSRAIDEHTETIARLVQEISEIEAEIAEAQDTIAKTKEELAGATTQREAEHAEWMTSDAEDKEMKAVVIQAKQVLEKFYRDNELMLLQRRRGGQPGKAPPPPPPTWEAPYGGQTKAATNIIAILDNTVDDLDKDIDHAKTNEDKAQSAFDKFKAESEAFVQKLEGDITALETAKGGKADTIASTRGDQLATKKDLEAVMETIADAEPGCNFLAVNYPVRRSNRQLETDGLLKAQAILQGGVFDPEDPNRELKPGDAAAAASAASFLQRRRLSP